MCFLFVNKCVDQKKYINMWHISTQYGKELQMQFYDHVITYFSWHRLIVYHTDILTLLLLWLFT